MKTSDLISTMKESGRPEAQPHDLFRGVMESLGQPEGDQPTISVRSLLILAVLLLLTYGVYRYFRGDFRSNEPGRAGLSVRAGNR